MAITNSHFKTSGGPTLVGQSGPAKAGHPDFEQIEKVRAVLINEVSILNKLQKEGLAKKVEVKEMKAELLKTLKEIEEFLNVKDNI